MEYSIKVLESFEVFKPASSRLLTKILLHMDPKLTSV